MLYIHIDCSYWYWLLSFLLFFILQVAFWQIDIKRRWWWWKQKIPQIPATKMDSIWHMSLKFSGVACNCKRARIMYLHPCCTTNQHFMTTNSINCDEGTYQTSRIVMWSQMKSIVASIRDRQCRHPLMPSCGSGNELLSMQRRRQTSSSM